ncbi:hypothetical protein GCK72_011749 [Caenorhabditis remanei]|uniref:Uncharacterized protein n=1 Tax=Caenorhabditis remanei TaxID=31234 RepID=A0A6A5HAM2_CAERE|nr:hypothetical protein GCK72_011749 [Caenorhabditis remanei]KAF1763483.1 hypothetical protein GCK72_011749 [Caenorhabditis remanei]
MPDVDLNQKVWGVKAKTHFLIFAAIHVLGGCICLIVFIDYMSMPSNAPDKAKGLLHIYLYPLLGACFQACVGAALLTCLPYKLFYIIVMIFLCIIGVFNFFSSAIHLVLGVPNFLFDEKTAKLTKKYYKCGNVGIHLSGLAASFVFIYLAIVLYKLGFAKPPPPPPPPRVIVRRHDEVDDEESDREEERPKSGGRRPRTPQKSGKREQSGTAERSEASGTGRLDKTGRSGEKSGKPGPGKTTEEEILAITFHDLSLHDTPVAHRVTLPTNSAPFLATSTHPLQLVPLYTTEKTALKMSQSVDLNYKVFGFKARSHIIAYFILEFATAALLFAAVIDYLNLPSKPPPGVKKMVLDELFPLPLNIAVLGCFVSIMFCCSNRIAYGIIGVLILLVGILRLMISILGLVGYAILGGSTKGYAGNFRKYYKLTYLVHWFNMFAEAIIRIYIGVVLFNLSFLYPVDPVIVYVEKKPNSRVERSLEESKQKTDSGPGNSGKTGGESGGEEE